MCRDYSGGEKKTPTAREQVRALGKGGESSEGGQERRKFSDKGKGSSSKEWLVCPPWGERAFSGEKGGGVKGRGGRESLGGGGGTSGFISQAYVDHVRKTVKALRHRGGGGE